MIKSLRKKFIIVAMCSTLVVLFAIMGIVNIANYKRIVSRADGITQLLAENGGDFEKKADDKAEEKKTYQKITGEKTEKKNRPEPEGMSPETPFSTRFFTVTLDEQGNIISSDLGKIAAITQEDAEEYAKTLFQKNSKQGFYGIYRYRMADSGDDESMIIFLDCRQDLENFKTFALTSVAVSLLGLLAVFILVMIFSKIVFRPVEKNYEKQKQFITDASHEIKTPLTIIDANTEVLEMESGENQWTKSTRNQIKRLSSLTYQLVTLSKLDEETGRMLKSEFSMSDVVADSIEPFQALARTENKKLNISIDENINYVGEEGAIRQLVSILMDNAIKYSAKEGDIRLSLKRKGKKIYLEIWNQAENIPVGNMDILFERFYRMDASRNSETGGSGIGLALAKSIVTSHRGKITAFSDDGKSLRITIEFTSPKKSLTR